MEERFSRFIRAAHADPTSGTKGGEQDATAVR